MNYIQKISDKSIKKSFRLRVLLRTVDVRTHPDAIARLLEIEQESQGRVVVRYGDNHFHAKVFAFKRNRTEQPRVLIGSANLTQKAIGRDSGELGVWIGPSKTSGEAWETLENMHEEGGSPSKGDWFAQYEKKFVKREELEKQAERIQISSKKQRRFKPPSFLDGTPFYVLPIGFFDKEEQQSMDRGWDFASQTHPELPNRPPFWSWYSSQKKIKLFVDRYPLVMDIACRNRGEPGRKLCSITFARPRGAIRLFDPELKKFYPVVWFERCRKGHIDIPQRGRTAETFFKKYGDIVKWLEKQDERMPRKANRQKLVDAFQVLYSACQNKS